MEEFNEISKALTTSISKQSKKDNGIFFTPRSYREILLNKVQCYVGNHNHDLRILEPSFGSGEFIIDIAKEFTASHITGVEINEKMYIAFDEVVSSNEKLKERVSIHHADFIQFKPSNKYDLVVGNPPYVVVKTKGVPREFKSITTGRPNLYCWFLYKCIGLLNDNGVLAFIIPNSLLNTSYYEPLRKYIHAECDILDIIHFNDKKFMDTDQDTIGLIIQKTPKYGRNTKHVVCHNGKVIFSIHDQFLQNKLVNYKSLRELGFGVRTGTIVWNQVKSNLTSNASEGTLLIYSSNFKHGQFENIKEGKEKKQYVKSSKPKEKGPVILMHRGYGNGTYNSNVMLVKESINGVTEFYAENHVNVIYPITDKAKEDIELVYKYLMSDDNREYIAKFTGNGAMSKTEIEIMLPISLTVT